VTTIERDLSRTTDLPAQQTPRTSVDLADVAERYALPLRAGYLLCIGIATLLHLGFDTELVNAGWRLKRALTPHIGFKDIVDGARNIALFLGWGATYVLTSKSPSTRRDVLLATLFGMLASITVETAQMFSQFRMASIADVFTNTLGSLIGAATVWLMERRMSTDVHRGTLIGVPGWLSGSALLMTAFGLTFAPSSRATMVIGWASSPMERARFVAATSAIIVPWTALVTDIVVWAVVGLMLAIAISDRTGRVRWGRMVAWILIIAVVLLLAHGGRALAGLQREANAWPVQTAAVAVGLLGGLMTAARWRARVPARATRALQVAGLAVLVGAVMAWSPATWVVTKANSPAFSWRQLVPMMSLFQRQDLSSVFLVLQKAGIGAAVGACLAARKRVGAPRPGLRAAIAVAALFEIGQLLVPGRYPDITDVMITSAAAGLVAVLVERAHRGHDVST
jgi:glycopeptide antibiotics resistance protein